MLRPGSFPHEPIFHAAVGVFFHQPYELQSSLFIKEQKIATGRLPLEYPSVNPASPNGVKTVNFSNMKIIAWNCNMAFRKKASVILARKPDILVVSECEHPGKLKFSDDTPAPTDKLWFGTNHNKGLGIFSYSQLRFTLLDTYNPDLKMVIPILVSGGDIDFILYAVWAYNPNDPDGRYVAQLWKAIHYYNIQLTNTPTILTGDFNSNTIWDKPRRKGNHSYVVKFLEEKKIYSTYHLYHKQVQGKEKHPTFYLHRYKSKPYHIDYCFTSDHFSGKLKSVEIGDYDFWTQYSDHVPVIVTFRKTRKRK